MGFRFEEFADAPTAQAAFEAAFPTGSRADAALQALVDMGAQCKAFGTNRVACRYLESEKALAGFCWQVALEVDSKKVIERASVSLSILAV